MILQSVRGGGIVKRQMKKLCCSLLLLGMLLPQAAMNGADTADAAGGTWKKSQKGWWYSYSDGTFAHGQWIQDNGNWYYFDAEGYMATDWREIDGKWYFFGPNGKMRTGWKKNGWNWYYFNPAGAMVIGWREIKGQWYFFDSQGAMVTGRRRISDTWYVFAQTGELMTQKKTIQYRYADAAEASEMLLAHTDYYQNMNQRDLDFRVQKKGATLDEMMAVVADCGLDFTDVEKYLIDDAMAEIEAIYMERGYHMPEIGDVVFAKTTAQEECQASAYTHGTEIYLGEEFLEYVTSDDPEIKEDFRCVLAHEIFHCLTRYYPEFRKEMYSIIGFTVTGKDYPLGENIREKMISNPDVRNHDSYATFTINGKKTDCIVIYTTKRGFRRKGDLFFDCELVGLVPVDDLNRMYTKKNASDFWEVFGENTDYVIDPEEAMADEFGYTIVFGVDGLEYETPEIIEKIDEKLKEKSLFSTP